MTFRFLISLFLFFTVSLTLEAQNPESHLNIEWATRIQSAPETVFKMFREAGLQPVNHILTDKERDKVEKAFAVLPPLHRRILKDHLHSISFMDNMPNTALTSPVETTDSTKKFNITFRAEIINETISQWATWKENTYYIPSEGNEFELSVEAGDLDALVYVLLHEATHVVDAVLELSPHPEEGDALVEPTAFTQDIWYKMNVPKDEITNPLLEMTRFRSGKPIPISHAPEVYTALQETPFVSLYSMAAWFEDLAEIATIYHLVEKLNQPFRVSVKKNNKVMKSFEPLKNRMVKPRLRHLEVFYEETISKEHYNLDYE